MTTAAHERGLTLAELLVASTLALVVIAGLGTIDVARLRMYDDLTRRSGLLSDQIHAAMAAQQLNRDLKRADRILVINTGLGARALPDETTLPAVEPFTSPPGADRATLQLRIPRSTTDSASCAGCAGAGAPPACCLDIAANYQWVQYQRDAEGHLWLYLDPPRCAKNTLLSGQITSFTVQYRDESPPLSQGDPPVTPAGADNNVLEYQLGWSDGTRSQTLHGEVTSRAIPYANVGAGGGNSGLGLNPADPSAPEACSNS